MGDLNIYCKVFDGVFVVTKKKEKRSTTNTMGVEDFFTCTGADVKKDLCVKLLLIEIE